VLASPPAFARGGEGNACFVVILGFVGMKGFLRWNCGNVSGLPEIGHSFKCSSWV
jgi:hypothetical protein